MDATNFDIRIIPEFDGKQPVLEWLEKVELVCRLKSVTEIENVIPLRLTGGAFNVYQQLSEDDKRDASRIKAALCTAFAADKFTAYDQFVSRRLGPGESVDVFLSDLRRLALLFGGLSDAGLICAFVAGLPESVRHTLRAGSRVESLSLTEVLGRARALLADEGCTGAVAAAPRHMWRGTGNRQQRHQQGRDDAQRCYRCGEEGHFARACRKVVCFRCQKTGHVATQCPGNARGVEMSAPASSPPRSQARFPREE